MASREVSSVNEFCRHSMYSQKSLRSIPKRSSPAVKIFSYSVNAQSIADSAPEPLPSELKTAYPSSSLHPSLAFQSPAQTAFLNDTPQSTSVCGGLKSLPDKIMSTYNRMLPPANANPKRIRIGAIIFFPANPPFSILQHPHNSNHKQIYIFYFFQQTFVFRGNFCFSDFNRG